MRKTSFLNHSLSTDSYLTTVGFQLTAMVSVYRRRWMKIFLDHQFSYNHTANPTPRFMTCIDSAELTEYSEIRPINS